MNKLTSLLLVPYLLVLVGCAESSRVVQLEYQITSTHAKLTKQKHNLNLVAIGSAGPVKTEGIILGYESNQPMQIPEARRLFLDLTQNLVDIVNANEEIRPYLANYPFTYKNTKITIYFFKKYSIYQDPPYLATVVYLPRCDMIYYDYYDNQADCFMHGKGFSETYDEAVEIVRKEKEATTK